jgi:predicted permease
LLPPCPRWRLRCQRTHCNPHHRRSSQNAGNYGLPAARFAFGQEGFDRAVLFFVVQAILAQTLAIYIAGAGHGDRRGGLVQLLKMPQIYAVLAALAVRFGGLRLDPAG